jgi:hypothetical protein
MAGKVEDRNAGHLQAHQFAPKKRAAWMDSSSLKDMMIIQ